jgi:hypothetical protein
MDSKMTLEEFIVSKGGKPAIIYEGTEEVKVTVLELNKGSGDRFQSMILHDQSFPNVIFVAKDKLRGLTIVPHQEVLNNHNNLHTTTKENYEKLLEEIKEHDIEFELNEDTYNL